MYSGITSGRVLNGELLYTKILEVNLFAFAYRLFRRNFSPLNGTYCIYIYIYIYIWVILARCRSFGFEAAKFRIGLSLFCALRDDVNHRKLW